ncbi:MAG: hypothetical protein KF854_10335 [Nitrospira sp.]|nr:hypothetical protein [Nitrospira sp.]MBX7040154.1 hypothetical protein [Nitrospira sp.]MCW5796531.1 hypothetical protein [Nitrospira sp.]HMU30874.1 hypothetical protein [Nitrospira sp.]HMV57926.1 hypothetical protein [Nitrospira sp.]
MKQQIQRPVRRTEQQKPTQDKDGVWPLSAREFMKLPVSGLLSTGKRIRFTRLTPPDQAA